ncbi:MAG: amidase [Caldilineales bacterium]|nr:amidase [Caldilineales bacterium]
MSPHPHPLAATVAGLRSNEIDLLSYLDRLCDRIDAVEPHIQALLPEPDRRARLLAEAQALLERYPDPVSRPPLFGAPVGVKDIIPADGFVTRGGSLLPPEVLARPEAACVTLLKAAGALILGKTVTTEFAFFEPGPTRNPHDLGHTPGGSSSGSAAAVAAGLAPLSLGTQTIGSVIRPAAFCGVVGFKPSYGRLPAAGILFFSRAVDHIGLFTQDVAGAALAASCLIDDWRPVGGAAIPRLGIPDGPYLAQAEAEALIAFESQVARLEAAGFEIVRAPLFPDIDAINRRHRRLIAFEFAQEHAHLFARFESLYRPRTAALIREGQAVAAGEADEIRAGRAVLRGEIERVMAESGIDLWLSPAATGPAPAGLGSTGDPIMNLPWTYAGLPALTLPAGWAANGLPLGLQLVGRWRADESLLNGAAAMQTLAVGAL